MPSRNLVRLFLVAILSFVVSACSLKGSPVPEGYRGPTATIRDSSFAESAYRAEFFYVSEVNGTPIRTNLDVAREFGFNKGFLIAAAVIDRDVPARPLVLKLEGRVAYGAPIQEIVMASKMYSVIDTIEFEPTPGAYYFVQGKLSESGSAVWLEESTTRARVGMSISR